jgi:hypothetical protein
MLLRRSDATPLEEAVTRHSSNIWGSIAYGPENPSAARCRHSAAIRKCPASKSADSGPSLGKELVARQLFHDGGTFHTPNFVSLAAAGPIDPALECPPCSVGRTVPQGTARCHWSGASGFERPISWSRIMGLENLTALSGVAYTENQRDSRSFKCPEVVPKLKVAR